MKTVETIAFQGDVMFKRVDALPKNAKDVTPKDGRLVVAHSETGHDHVASGPHARLFAGDDPMVCYLQASDTISVEHLRPYDTHEALALLGGPDAVWKVTRQREWAPEGWRVVQD